MIMLKYEFSTELFEGSNSKKPHSTRRYSFYFNAKYARVIVALLHLP